MKQLREDDYNIQIICPQFSGILIITYRPYGLVH